MILRFAPFFTVIFYKNLKINKSLPTQYIILEISQNLIKYQQERIRKEFPNHYNIFKWVTNLEDIKIDGLIIANEFFDALPTERFRINNSKLETLYIESNNNYLNYEILKLHLFVQAQFFLG